MGFSEDDRIRAKNAKCANVDEADLTNRYRLRSLKKDVEFYKNQAEELRSLLREARWCVEGIAEIHEIENREKAVNVLALLERIKIAVDGKPQRFVQGSWRCTDNKKCTFDIKEDPAMDQCLKCGMPQERK